MGETTEVTPIPQEPAKKTEFDVHGEVVDSKYKPRSQFAEKVSGLIALARHGIRVWRNGWYGPVRSGQVRSNLEDLKSRIDNTQPFEPNQPT